MLIIALSLFVCACKTPSPQAQWATSVLKSFKNTWQAESAGISLHQAFIIETRVIVARNGEVVSAAITKPSGNQQADTLAAQVLKSVKQVPPIPAGLPDVQKTFIIVFNARPRD
jgi:TonB family protein